MGSEMCIRDSNQSGIPAEEFRTRLRQRIHAEALAEEEDDDEDEETEEV